MFEGLKPLPQDPILQLMQQFREDPRQDKVDLGIGVYKDAAGHTPIMAAVREAERRLLATETSKSYVGPAGSAGFNDAMAALILGRDNALRRDGRVSVVQTREAVAPCAWRRNSCGCAARTPPSGSATPPGATTGRCLAGPAWPSVSIRIWIRRLWRWTSRRCWRPWHRPGPVTWCCCTAVATTHPGPT